MAARRKSLGTDIPGMNVISATFSDLPQKTAAKGKTTLFEKMGGYYNSKLDETSNTLGLNFIMAATEPEASTARTCLLLFGLLAVVMLQMTLMGTFYLVSSLQPCASHSDCKSGEYCCKCNDYCRDCADANFRPSYIPPEDFVNYVGHCNATDIFPTRCDHLVKNTQASSAFDTLGIVVSSFLLAGYLAQDLTEAITEHALLLYRVRDIPPTRAAIARAFGWILFRLRAYLLPFYVIGGVTALIVMNPMKIDQVMLNFLSISFILETDNLFNQIFVHP